MDTVFALYVSREDLAIDVWDLCGVYATRALASDAITRILNEEGGVIDDFAIDPIVINADLE